MVFAVSHDSGAFEWSGAHAAGAVRYLASAFQCVAVHAAGTRAC
jgi:hypothetical protein